METGRMIDISRLPDESAEHYAARLRDIIATHEDRIRLLGGEAALPAGETLQARVPVRQEFTAETIIDIDMTRRPRLADDADRHGTEWMLERDPEESDEAFERRRQLFAANGHVVADAEKPPVQKTHISEEFRWPEEISILPGGAVIADALLAFDAMVADPDIAFVVVPISERGQVVIYRKLLTKLSREEYDLHDEVYLGNGKVVHARDLIGDDG